MGALQVFLERVPAIVSGSQPWTALFQIEQAILELQVAHDMLADRVKWNYDLSQVQNGDYVMVSYRSGDRTGIELAVYENDFAEDVFLSDDGFVVEGVYAWMPHPGIAPFPG